MFFTTTYGIPKLSNYVYKNSFWRSKLSGSIAISPELYVIAETIKTLIKTKGKSYSGFIDLTSSVLSGYESLKNVVKNSPPDFIVPLALLSGNVLAKALGNYVENFDYSLTAYERFQMTWKAGLEIEDPYLTKLKESADYLERVYTSLGEELLSNSKLAGAAYGLGNKANAQSKGGNSQGVFEKLKQKSGENNLQNIRTEGRGIKARKPRLAPKRKRINEKTKAQVDAEQIDRHKKRLDSLPKSAEATIDLTYSPRDLWASRQNPPSVNNLLEELGGTRMLGEKNWAADPEQIDNWRGRSWLRRNQPAYFSACFNEFQSVSDSSGIKQFVSKFNVFGSCRNAIVVFSKKFQAALNKLAQLTPTDPKADEILRELQKLILPIDVTLIDKGVVKGSNLGPINEITMGKGIAHYIGGNQNTQKNIFHLPETDYVGNIDGGVGASNILNASKLNATTVVYADSVLETIPKNSEATTSAISFFLGRKDLQEVVDCKKMPDISVNSQGGRIGALDQLFNCRYIKVSGFTDVESHLPGDYQLLIETESQGYISIHLPNAYKVNIIFPDILNVVKLGIFFYNPFEKSLSISIKNLHLKIFLYQLEVFNIKFFDLKNRNLLINPVYNPSSVENIKPIQELKIIHQLGSSSLNDFLSYQNFTFNDQQQIFNQINQEETPIAFLGTKIADFLPSVLEEAALQLLQGNEGADTYDFTKADLDYLSKLNLPILINNYSPDSKIDTLEFACSIQKLSFLKNGDDLDISFEKKMIIKVINYFFSASNQHLIILDENKLAWSFFKKISSDGIRVIINNIIQNPAFQIQAIPFYTATTQQLLSLQSISNFSELAIGLDPNKLIPFRNMNDLWLITEGNVNQQDFTFKLILEDFFVNQNAWNSLILVHAENAQIIEQSSEYRPLENFLSECLTGRALIKLAPFIVDIETIQKEEVREQIDFYQPKLKPIRSLDTYNHDIDPAGNIELNEYIYHTRYLNDTLPNIERKGFINLTNTDIKSMRVAQESRYLKFSFNSVSNLSYKPLFVNWEDSNHRLEGIIKDNHIIIAELTTLDNALKIESIINLGFIKNTIEKYQEDLLTPLALEDLKAFLFFNNSYKDKSLLLSILNFRDLIDLEEFLAVYFVLYPDIETRLERFRSLWKDENLMPNFKAMLWQSLLTIMKTNKTLPEIKECFSFIPDNILSLFYALHQQYAKDLDLHAINRLIENILISAEAKETLQFSAKIKVYNVSAENIPLIIEHNQQTVDSETIENHRGFLNIESILYDSIKATAVGNDLQLYFLNEKKINKVVIVKEWKRNIKFRLEAIIDKSLRIDAIHHYDLNAINEIQNHIDTSLLAYRSFINRKNEIEEDKENFPNTIKFNELENFLKTANITDPTILNKTQSIENSEELGDQTEVEPKVAANRVNVHAVESRYQIAGAENKARGLENEGSWWQSASHWVYGAVVTAGISITAYGGWLLRHRFTPHQRNLLPTVAKTMVPLLTETRHANAASLERNRNKSQEENLNSLESPSRYFEETDAAGENSSLVNVNCSWDVQGTLIWFDILTRLATGEKYNTPLGNFSYALQQSDRVDNCLALFQKAKQAAIKKGWGEESYVPAFPGIWEDSEQNCYYTVQETLPLKRSLPKHKSQKQKQAQLL